MMDAQKVFETMAERDVVSWNTLVLCHARLGQMGKAREIFDLIPVKTVVSWTVMISGYARTGCYGDALDVFHRMQLVGMKPDEISVVAVLSACTQLGALELGKWIHFYCERNGFLKNICVCNAFIEMYAKCGSIDEACEFFEKMWEKDVISWSTIIVALAKHGRAREAIQRFTEMERSRVLPNGITFLGILSACAHAGLLSEGLHYFDLLKENYFIDPTVEHYGCMVDLLGRLGYLDRAFEFINSMPIKPDASIWGSLLGASRTHEHLELAVTAMEHLVELEPDDASNYILLSNTYAAAGKWDSVLRMRKLMRSNSMKKTPGCSSIEVNNVVQEFIAGDDSNSSFDEIHSMLDLLVLQQS
ncbi:hypothetical protein GIB67_018311 [Kingdonia uniflora]|uniref:Pentatricopeptide repeat-containing protein n=1 Tax=Kingdonia uniflora TaxID=39325 RepID=A0A7J7MJB6_9MAGN|nr:hypothetical protein GIB67_018311 [Kingdonia uniflora]